MRLTDELASGDAPPPSLRECGCPWWVERCVHFGDYHMIFHHADPLEWTREELLADKYGWLVCISRVPPTFAPGSHADEDDHEWLASFEDYHTALAAFLGAERQLLEGALE